MVVNVFETLLWNKPRHKAHHCKTKHKMMILYCVSVIWKMALLLSVVELVKTSHSVVRNVSAKVIILFAM